MAAKHFAALALVPLAVSASLPHFAAAAAALLPPPGAPSQRERMATAVAPPLHLTPRDPPPGGWPNWTATWIFNNMTTVHDANCLDGSPPLYYVSPGFGDGADKWQLHHVGGAWCSDAQGCMGWWGWVNTLTFPATMPAYNAATASYAYFDRTAPTNSMWNWNYAFLHYCDGYSFVSDAPTVQVGNQSVWFRGHAISQAIRQDLLLNKGMDRATDVVVGGCSAGGMAVLLQCDAWADSIRQSNAATKTRCLADSGWFPWAPPETPNGDGFNEAWIGGYERMMNDANITEILSPDCVAKYANNGSFTWTCVMAEVNSLYTKTPMFVYQSQFDGFQIPIMEHCDNAPYCTPDNITWWGKNLVVEPITRWLASQNAVAANSVAFVDSCGHHCGDGQEFGVIKSWNRGNKTAAEVFGQWLDDPASVAGLWIQNTTFPCVGCCNNTA